MRDKSCEDIRLLAPRLSQANKRVSLRRVPLSRSNLCPGLEKVGFATRGLLRVYQVVGKAAGF